MTEIHEYVAENLDLPYVERVGRAIAEAIGKNEPIEANYQPGDGTSYGLLFVPIQELDVAPPRETEEYGKWDARVPFGVARVSGAAVVCWIGNGATALDFRTGGFHGSYIDGLFGGRGEASGWALAILFTAISEALE